MFVRTPVPPFNCLTLHVTVLRVPSGHGETSTRSFVLDILREHAASFYRCLGPCCVVFIEDLTVVGVSSFIICQNGTVVGVGILEFVLFGLRRLVYIEKSRTTCPLGFLPKSKQDFLLIELVTCPCNSKLC